MSGWTTLRLDEICVPQTGTRDPTRQPNAPFRYVDITAVDNKAKRIVEPSLLLGKDAPSRARQILKAGDVIVSMTRPNLNAVALVPYELDGEICSTGFAVLRCKPCVLPGYIFHYVRAPIFVSRTTAAVSGALYPAITSSFLRSLSIPLPPLDEQRRIVGLLDRAAEIRRRADAARAKTRAIIPALFLDMFGDPATNPKAWSMIKLGNLLKRIDGGWSPICADGPPAPGQWGILKLSAVKSLGFFGSEAKRLPEAITPREDLEVHEGDLLLTRKNTIDLVGTAAVADSSAHKRMLPDTIFRLVPSDPGDFVPSYISTLINLPSFRPTVKQLASGSASSMPGISKGRLSTLEVPVPDLRLQTAFAEQAQRLEATARALDAAAAKAEAMAAALSAEVFDTASVGGNPAAAKPKRVREAVLSDA